MRFECDDCLEGYSCHLENVGVGEIFQRGRKIVLMRMNKLVKDMKGGVIITCKVCGDPEIVNENSLCDKMKLCVNCMRKKLRARWKK